MNFSSFRVLRSPVPLKYDAQLSKMHYLPTIRSLRDADKENSAIRMLNSILIFDVYNLSSGMIAVFRKQRKINPYLSISGQFFQEIQYAR